MYVYIFIYLYYIVHSNENHPRQISVKGRKRNKGYGRFCKMSFVSQSCLLEEKDIYRTSKDFTDDVSKAVKYFLPTEIAVHNTEIDCWISYHDVVYDLTDLCKIWANKREIKPILAYAGKDISHWFDHEKNDIKHYIHPVTGVLVPYCPHGPIPDVTPSVVPCSTWRPLDKCPWWLDEKYKKGYLTKNARPCRILNVLVGVQVIIMVCEEDSIRRIQERALIYNENGKSYTWKFEGKDLNIDLTLTENGIPDERDRFVACGLPEDYYIPCLMCYYNEKSNNNTDE